jgi:hypothetical protein
VPKRTILRVVLLESEGEVELQGPSLVPATDREPGMVEEASREEAYVVKCFGGFALAVEGLPFLEALSDDTRLHRLAVLGRWIATGVGNLPGLLQGWVVQVVGKRPGNGPGGMGVS